MSENDGAHAGEPLAPITVRAWTEAALDGLPARERVELALEADALEACLVGPPRALGDALRGLLKNGIQASPPGERVTLRVEVRDGWFRTRVVDCGRGMTDEVLRRVGEPFFTTKSPGEGWASACSSPGRSSSSWAASSTSPRVPGPGPRPVSICRRPRPPERSAMNSVEGTQETLPSILLVDDDEVLRERLATAIRARGYEVRTAGSADEALREVAKESPEMAVLDLRMPGGGGLDLLKELRRQDPSTRVLMLTGYGSISTAVEAVREGAVGYLPKPADADDLAAPNRRPPRSSRGARCSARGVSTSSACSPTAVATSRGCRRLGITVAPQ
jgi:ActR/RegA family two-component response regulator